MRIDLFLILLLHTEDDLYRDMLRWIRWLKLISRIDPNWISAPPPQNLKFEEATLSGVLVQMGGLSSVRASEDIRDTHNRLPIDEIGSNSILVNSQSSQYRSSPGVDLETTIRNYTDYDLFPSFFAPCFRFGPST